MVEVPLLGSHQRWPRQYASPMVSVSSSSAIKKVDLRSQDFPAAAGAQPLPLSLPLCGLWPGSIRREWPGSGAVRALDKK